MTELRIRKLEEWVKAGGRLIVVAQAIADQDDRDDPLLDDISVRQYWSTPRNKRSSSQRSFRFRSLALRRSSGSSSRRFSRPRKFKIPRSRICRACLR